MLEINIPGFKYLRLEHLVLDYNGTIALDGKPIPGVNELIITLSRKINIHILTADTFGSAHKELDGLPCGISVIPCGGEDEAKLRYINELGPDSVVCFGNGRNDRLMLNAAALGIAVVQDEGASSEAIQSADIVCKSITAALELLVNPLRLLATLRL